jgi:selenocysteine lyase/cysteine desulfurase
MTAGPAPPLLLVDLRDGNKIVVTALEHNSNFVPWHALASEILPRFGRRVQLRLARFDAHIGGSIWIIWPRSSMRAPS